VRTFLKKDESLVPAESGRTIPHPNSLLSMIAGEEVNCDLRNIDLLLGTKET